MQSLTWKCPKIFQWKKLGVSLLVLIAGPAPAQPVMAAPLAWHTLQRGPTQPAPEQAALTDSCLRDKCFPSPLEYQQRASLAAGWGVGTLEDGQGARGVCRSRQVMPGTSCTGSCSSFGLKTSWTRGDQAQLWPSKFCPESWARLGCAQRGNAKSSTNKPIPLCSILAGLSPAMPMILCHPAPICLQFPNVRVLHTMVFWVGKYPAHTDKRRTNWWEPLFHLQLISSQVSALGLTHAAEKDARLQLKPWLWAQKLGHYACCSKQNQQ